jgi:hypothetical protein
MAENYLVKVLIPTYFPFIGVGNQKVPPTLKSQTA